LPLAVLVFGLAFSLLLFNSIFMTAFFLILGITLVAVLGRMPDFLANNWRMKASNQMVLCIFTTYGIMPRFIHELSPISFAHRALTAVFEHSGPLLRLGFGAKLAPIFWFEKWRHVFERHPPFVKWFVGAKTNLCYNCLDYHVERGRGGHAALIAEDERGERRVYTYAQLLEEVK
jgi:hypothetical protein